MLYTTIKQQIQTQYIVFYIVSGCTHFTFIHTKYPEFVHRLVCLIDALLIDTYKHIKQNDIFSAVINLLN